MILHYPDEDPDIFFGQILSYLVSNAIPCQEVIAFPIRNAYHGDGKWKFPTECFKKPQA